MVCWQASMSKWFVLFSCLCILIFHRLWYKNCFHNFTIYAFNKKLEFLLTHFLNCYAHFNQWRFQKSWLEKKLSTKSWNLENCKYIRYQFPEYIHSNWIKYQIGKSKAVANFNYVKIDTCIGIEYRKKVLDTCFFILSHRF